MVDKVFLTDARRDALNHYDKSNSNHRTHKSRVAERASVALDELLWVAQSPVIDHREVFPPEKVRALLVTLLAGSGGVKRDNPTDHADAWTPDTDDRNAWYTAINRALMHVERDADTTDLYEMLGERAAASRTPDES